MDLGIYQTTIHIPFTFVNIKIVALVLGVIFLRLELNQSGIMNINGVLFLLITNMSFGNLLYVINVSKSADKPLILHLQVMLRIKIN
jgi:hypothetical protein